LVVASVILIYPEYELDRFNDFVLSRTFLRMARFDQQYVAAFMSSLLEGDRLQRNFIGICRSTPSG
jgi:hypothetical protein